MLIRNKFPLVFSLRMSPRYGTDIGFQLNLLDKKQDIMFGQAHWCCHYSTRQNDAMANLGTIGALTQKVTLGIRAVQNAD
jgi:hypothetical protein